MCVTVKVILNVNFIFYCEKGKMPNVMKENFPMSVTKTDFDVFKSLILNNLIDG